MALSAETQAKLKRQIEFYFSDSNLPRDAFMGDQIAADPEGFVDISLLCTFKRMRNLLGIQEDWKQDKVPEQIVLGVAEPLRNSQTVTLSEDSKRVRRTMPLTSAEDALAQIDQRSLYASPFPFDTPLDVITDLFHQRAPVNCVRMRRHAESKDFRGSVFVEFADEAAAQKVLKEQLEFEGAPIHLEPKMDFVARKKVERKEKDERKEACAAAGNEQTAPSSVPAAEAEVRNPSSEGAPDQAEEAEEAYEEGLLLSIDFGDAEHDLYYSNLKESLGGGNPINIRFVEFQRGGSSGVVRYRAKDVLEKVLQQADSEGTMQIAGFKATIKKLEGEEEKDFYKRAAAQKKASKAAQDQGDRHGGGRGGQKRHARGGFRGGGRGPRQKRGRY